MDRIAEAPSRRYCEDCRFCQIPPTGLIHARCEKAPPPDTGNEFVAREFHKPGFCSTQRLDAQRCGAGAMWFEAKTAEVAQ